MPKKLIIRPTLDASKLSDKELIAEFTKRFIVPQFYTREHIEKRINDAGIEPTEEQIDDFIEIYKADGFSDVDDSLVDHIVEAFDEWYNLSKIEIEYYPYFFSINHMKYGLHQEHLSGRY